MTIHAVKAPATLRADAVTALADHLESIAEHSADTQLGFNMSSFISRRGVDRTGHGCGTVACLGGWAASMAHPELSTRELYHRFTVLLRPGEDIEVAGAQFLGLSLGGRGGITAAARELFYPTSSVEYSSITVDQAVSVLRHLAATGEVDWPRVLEPEPAE